jgi:hypothetical protein
VSYASKRTSDENLTGQVFETRTVLRYKGLRNGREYWECQCTCGRIRFCQAEALKSGKTKSCGCVMEAQIEAWRQESRQNSLDADAFVAKLKRKKEADECSK